MAHASDHRASPPDTLPAANINPIIEAPCSIFYRLRKFGSPADLYWKRILGVGESSPACTPNVRFCESTVMLFGIN